MMVDYTEYHPCKGCSWLKYHDVRTNNDFDVIIPICMRFHVLAVAKCPEYEVD